PLAGGAARFAGAAEEVPEDIPEHIAKAGWGAAGPGTSAAPKAGAHAAKSIVLATLLGIAEYLVGFAGLLEALLGYRIAGVLVRVILVRELAIGGLDLLGASGAAHAEYC